MITIEVNSKSSSTPAVCLWLGCGFWCGNSGIDDVLLVSM